MQQRKTISRGIDHDKVGPVNLRHKGTGTVVGYKVDRTGTKLPTH